MSSGNVGQDDLIEILENLFKAMNKKRALERRSKQAQQGVKVSLNEKNLNSEEISPNNELASNKKGSKNEKELVLPEDRLSKEEALTYLQAYSDHIDSEKYEVSSNFIDNKRVAINYKDKTNDGNSNRYSISFDLETNKGTIEHSYYGESKGSFQTVTDVNKVFSKEQLVQKYFELIVLLKTLFLHHQSSGNYLYFPHNKNVQ